jgi:hypothetical protein
MRRVLLAPVFLFLVIEPSLAEDLLKFNSVSTPNIGLGNTAVVRIDGLDAALGTGTRKISDFVLYLDGHAVATGADKGLTNTTKNELGFTLARGDDNKTAWTALLGSPTAFEKGVQVDVGIVGASSVLPTTSGVPVTATLTVVRPWGLIIGIVLIIALVFVLLKVGKASDLLRDNQPVDFGNAVGPNNAVLRRTFSLAQSQMAWWITLVLGAYVFLFLDYGRYQHVVGPSAYPDGDRHRYGAWRGNGRKHQDKPGTDEVPESPAANRRSGGGRRDRRRAGTTARAARHACP